MSIPWKDVAPGEGARLSNGHLVVRIAADSPLADGLRPEEARHAGVLVKTDAKTCKECRPGFLIVIGPDTEVEKVVWHGDRTPLQEAP